MLRKMGEWRKTSEYVWPKIERICSGKASFRSWPETKWTDMLRKNTHFATKLWEWTGMLRNNSEFLLILFILLSIYGRTDIKKSLFLPLRLLTAAPEWWTGMLRNMYLGKEDAIRLLTYKYPTFTNNTPLKALNKIIELSLIDPIYKKEKVVPMRWKAPEPLSLYYHHLHTTYNYSYLKYGRSFLISSALKIPVAINTLSSPILPYNRI